MPVTDYTPTTADVAKLLRARTRDSFGNLVGDFTDKTTPNREQASGLIADAADEVSEALGSELPPDLLNAAKRLTTLLAAANIEMSFYPEQAAAQNSMYDKLMQRIKDLRTSLEEDVAEEVTATTEPPSFGFPDPVSWSSVMW